MNNRLYEEAQVIEWTNDTGSDVAAGDVVDLTNLVGVAQDDIANGESGILHVKGVFTLPKDDNLVVSQGDRVYYDTSNAEVDKTAEDQTYAGIAWSAATQTATTVPVAINFPTKVEVNDTP